MGLHNFYLYISCIAIFLMAIFGLFVAAFKGSLLRQLSTRITVLILLSGPITLILIPVSNKFIQEIGVHDVLVALTVYVLIALGTPLLLGLLAARFVRRPLRQFSDTVVSLKHDNYKVQVRPTGISEFDEVFSEFNDLIQRLRQEEKLRKDLISDTSHELNTPLATMIGQLTAMHEGKLPPTKERLATLKEQSERLADLVQQLDAYTKARMPHDGGTEAISLRRFCEGLIGQFSMELEQKGIIAVLHIAEDTVVRANRSALQKILTNFMQNTLRYSEATELTISADEHSLTFSDNGKGVSSKNLPHLFERFYRVDKSRSRKTGGLGLGLAIVRELVEQQGWHIHAEHAHPGLSFVLTMD